MDAGRPQQLKPDASPIVQCAGEIGRGSNAGLHANTYTADGRPILVGSFNLDPQSALLNTDMGLVIDSAGMATELSADPQSGWFERAAVRIGTRLPIEWLL